MWYFLKPVKLALVVICLKHEHVSNVRLSFRPRFLLSCHFSSPVLFSRENEGGDSLFPPLYLFDDSSSFSSYRLLWVLLCQPRCTHSKTLLLWASSSCPYTSMIPRHGELEASEFLNWELKKIFLFVCMALN